MCSDGAYPYHDLISPKKAFDILWLWPNITILQIPCLKVPLPARSNSVRRGGRPERRRHSCYWANQGKLRWATKTHQYETVSPFAGSPQNQTGESERVHMGRHLQTPGASDQNFVLILMIWSCEKTTHTWNSIKYSIHILKPQCIAFSL